MSRLTPERRGAWAALGVAVAIGVLLVVLQPGPKPVRRTVASEGGPIGSTTTTLPAGVQLCNLAKQFARDATGLEPNGVARVAEVFYEDAAKLVDGTARAEFEATARYYAEYNDIGQEFDYDVFRIAAAGKGDRWAQLVYRPPLGIETARAAVQFACTVELPVPPTRTTLLEREDPIDSILGRSSGSTGTPTSGASPATSAPAAPATTR